MILFFLLSFSFNTCTTNGSQTKNHYILCSPCLLLISSKACKVYRNEGNIKLPVLCTLLNAKTTTNKRKPHAHRAQVPYVTSNNKNILNYVIRFVVAMRWIVIMIIDRFIRKFTICPLCKCAFIIYTNDSVHIRTFCQIIRNFFFCECTFISQLNETGA